MHIISLSRCDQICCQNVKKTVIIITQFALYAVLRICFELQFYVNMRAMVYMYRSFLRNLNGVRERECDCKQCSFMGWQDMVISEDRFLNIPWSSLCAFDSVLVRFRKKRERKCILPPTRVVC